MLVQRLLENARSRPGAEALVDGGRRVDYSTLADAAMRFAGLLQARGLQAGDRVAIVLPNGIEAVVACYGCWIAGCIAVEQDDAHRLVEECMLAANEAACRTLDTAGLDQLHRVHPEPDASRIAETCQTLREAGVLTTAPTDRRQLAALFESLAGRPDAAAWTATLLRSLPRAEYAVDRQGHFGLAKSHYAHFTSPIRRYPDLITHRLLKAHLAGQTAAVTAPELRCIAMEATAREKVSQTAERHLADIKRLRWLHDETRCQRTAAIDAIITGVGPRGADLYLNGIGLFGWLPTPRSAGALRLGDRLQVRPAKVDPVRRDLELMLAPDAARTTPANAPDTKAPKAGRSRNGRRRPRKAAQNSNGKPPAKP